MLLDILQTYGWVLALLSALVIAGALIRARHQAEAERRERAEWNLRTRDDQA